LEESKQPGSPETGTPVDDVPLPRRRRVRKVIVRLLGLLVAVIVGLIVTGFAIDLGPYVRGIAEKQGSNYLKRPMHIGRLSAKLTPGVFVVEDLVIEGLEPQSRPFLRAKKITVDFPWWTVFTRKLIIESVTMTDWEMVLETFPSSPEYPNGRHNLPKLTPERRDPNQPRRVNLTTTLKAVLADRGKLTFEDHGAPWSTVAPNLTVQLYRSGLTNDYRGRAAFSDGTINILTYEPFGANMRSRFNMQGGRVRFDRIDLLTDGARSIVTGDMDLGRWPEQLYQITSVIDFPTQKNIFFHNQNFTVSGTADFTGTFRLFKGGRDLRGTFHSKLAGVNAWRFRDLDGSVLWVPDRLDVTRANAKLYGGTARFDYRMAPLNRRDVPARATWNIEHRNVNLAMLTDFFETEGLRLSGSASGSHHIEWPIGKWALKEVHGEVAVDPPAGVQPMTREFGSEQLKAATSLPVEEGPFNPRADIGYVPVAGRIVYSMDPEWIDLDKSWAATPKTFVEFEGQTAYGQRSQIPFHVTSLDWQESDRVLAGIMTAFGAQTGAVPVGGLGEFDGVLLESFTRPRIQGRFSGERLKAWDVVWGSGRGDVTIENSYAHVTSAVVATPTSEIHAAGQFSLGFPRKDNGVEIDARVKLVRRPMADLKHAFELDDYNMDGLVSGEYHIFGQYLTPHGFGRLLVEKGVAYGESFDTAEASLRFEGNGVRLDGLDIKKGVGQVVGAAFVGWDGTYSFNADGERIPLESLDTISFPQAPLTGLLQFNSTGAGTFESPRYEVKLRVDDLFAGDEGIGQLTGRIGVRDEVLNAELEAASPRLSVSGAGRIALTPEKDAELTFRFTDTSLDPYVRFFEPRLSPFTTAIVGGTVRVVGELANWDQLVVETNVEQLDLKLFDYPLRNQAPIKLTLDRQVLKIDDFRLTGEGTELQLDGDVSLRKQLIDVNAKGDANLGILQGFFRDIRSRGTATLTAEIDGPFSKPVFSGAASIADGRLRHFSLPHSLEAVNGRILFDAGGIRIDETSPLVGRLGGGQVTFGGRIGLNGFMPGELNLTARGERMNVRYPEGFRSVIDADLRLEGTLSAPLLAGNVVVRDALWSQRFEANPDIFNFGGGGSTPAPVVAGPPAQTIPLRFEINVEAADTLRIENNLARMVASATLQLRGTYDRPQLFGRAEIDRGDFVFEGNRYLVTQGTVDFFNPSRIEPFFDVEAETRVRLPGQTYRVTIGLSGTPSRLAPPLLNSDPPLPMVDIIGLVFGQTPQQDAELRALVPGAAQQQEEALIRQGLARVLTGSISAPIDRAFEQTFGATVQITPSLGSETDPLTPSARLVIGRRLSNRAYLTFARALGNSQHDQILIIEFDQSDRLGWVFTQNGDGTFAIDFRVRRRF
jgi:hypothetical protein